MIRYTVHCDGIFRQTWVDIEWLTRNPPPLSTIVNCCHANEEWCFQGDVIVDSITCHKDGIYTVNARSIGEPTIFEPRAKHECPN